MAWLSDGTTSPSTRFPLAGSTAAGPYALVGEPFTTIADDWTGLTTCTKAPGTNCLDNLLVRTETGALQYEEIVFTGTNADGGSSSRTCDGWTATSGQSQSGANSYWDAAWTSACTVCSCTSDPAGGRIYCFQQG